MSDVLQAPPVPRVPVAGGGSFPVRRIYCVGRNYVEHAIEMGDTGREPPFFFLKPADSVVPVEVGQTGRMRYPSLTQDLQHEVELVVAIGRGGSRIPAAEALGHVWGYAVGLDMTRRDLQIQMREVGRPWEIGKAFDQSAPTAPLHKASEVGHFEKGGIWLKVNGQDKQRSDTSKLIWSVAETVAYLSKYFRLEPGDLIFTGTPEGVGPVVKGDVMEGGVDGLGTLNVRMV